MRNLTLIAVLALGIAACGAETPKAGTHTEGPAVEPEPFDPNGASAEAAALSGCKPVSAEGYCGISFGMSPANARATFPVKLEDYSGDTSTKPDPNACFEMFAAEPVQGVTFLVENAKVGRVDVISEGPKTADGFGVGSTAEALKAKYGAALTEAPNKYEPEVKELSIMQGSTKFIFEIQGAEVRAFRAGVAPTIDYVEHCG